MSNSKYQFNELSSSTEPIFEAEEIFNKKFESASQELQVLDV